MHPKITEVFHYYRLKKAKGTNFNETEELRHKIIFKLLPSEKILYMGRKHWITLLFSLLIHPFILLILLFTLLFLKTEYLNLPLGLLLDFILCLLCTLALIGTYTVLNWYYEFYIITSRRLIKTHLFRTVGTYYDEIFHESDTETEVSYISRNWLYDMLNIEDVSIQFRNLARVAPFVFDTPTHPKKIERILEEISLREAKPI